MKIKKIPVLPVFLLPLFFFVFNLVSKYLYVGANDISIDEPFSIFISQFDVRSIIAILSNGNNPPLYELLLHFWTSISGTDALAVRLPSVVFSALTAVYVFQIGKNNFNPFTGFFAAAFFSVSTVHVLFSHEARVYALFVLSNAALLYYFLEIVKGRISKRKISAFIIWGIIAMYSHYFFVFPLGIITASLLHPKVRKTALKPLLITLAIWLLAYSPQLVFFVKRIQVSATDGTWITEHNWRWIYGMIIRFFNTRFAVLSLIIIGFYTLKILTKEKRLSVLKSAFTKLAPHGIILAWFVLPYFSLYFFSFLNPIFIERYVLFTSIPLYIIVSAFCLHITNNDMFNRIAVFFILITMLLGYELRPSHNRNPSQIAKHLRVMQAENDILLISPAYLSIEFSYYRYPELFHLHTSHKASNEHEARLPLSEALRENNTFFAENTADTSFLKVPHEKIWYLFLDIYQESTAPLNRYLQANYNENSSTSFDNGIYTLKEFVKKPQ